MLWVFARVSNQDAIRRTKKRLQAYLLELRLFGDEPALLWKSQKDLLRTNVRYLSLMLGPALILTVPVVILLFSSRRGFTVWLRCLWANRLSSLSRR